MAEGRNMSYKIIKTNKLIKVHLIDLWIESCVDESMFEKVIRHNKMQTSTMYKHRKDATYIITDFLWRHWLDGLQKAAMSSQPDESIYLYEMCYAQWRGEASMPKMHQILLRVLPTVMHWSCVMSIILASRRARVQPWRGWGSEDYCQHLLPDVTCRLFTKPSPQKETSESPGQGQTQGTFSNK
jgi:hypothetical protein